MNETELKPENIQKSSESETVFKDCDNSDENKDGFIKSNGWKTTFLVVLVKKNYDRMKNICF